MSACALLPASPSSTPFAMYSLLSAPYIARATSCAGMTASAATRAEPSADSNTNSIVGIARSLRTQRPS